MREFRLLVVLMSLCLAACALVSPSPAHVAGEDYLVAYFPDLPADAQRVAERMAACLYWRGEIMGDDSQRQAHVSAALSALDCADVEQDEATMRAKYAGNTRVQQALDSASHWFANQASIAFAWS